MALERLTECHYWISFVFVSSLICGSEVGDSLFFYSMCTHTVYIYIFISQFKKPKS